MFDGDTLSMNGASAVFGSKEFKTKNKNKKVFKNGIRLW